MASEILEPDYSKGVDWGGSIVEERRNYGSAKTALKDRIIHNLVLE